VNDADVSNFDDSVMNSERSGKIRWRFCMGNRNGL